MPSALSLDPLVGFLSGVVELCYPASCDQCGVSLAEGRLCRACSSLFRDQAASPVCWRCAATSGPFTGTPDGCDLCSKESFAFERVVRLGPYRDALAEACIRLKRPSGFRLGSTLVELLCDLRRADLSAFDVDMVIGVPLHWSRRMTRGYDQAAHLAESFARRLGKPLERRRLYRRRPTRKQALLPFTARKENVRNAFAARPSPRLKGATVLLVDDILTSGSTCHQAARALKSAGARRVFVAVLARGETTPRRVVG